MPPRDGEERKLQPHEAAKLTPLEYLLQGLYRRRRARRHHSPAGGLNETREAVRQMLEESRRYTTGS